MDGFSLGRRQNPQTLNLEGKNEGLVRPDKGPRDAEQRGEWQGVPPVPSGEGKEMVRTEQVLYDSLTPMGAHLAPVSSPE